MYSYASRNYRRRLYTTVRPLDICFQLSRKRRCFWSQCCHFHHHQETPETYIPKRRGNKHMTTECRLYSNISLIHNGFHPTRPREAIHVQRNIEVRSRNHCCRGHSISSTYSDCVSLALVSY